MNCGEKLKKLRGKKTLEQMAKEVGVTASAWAMYEKNERTPRDEVKIKIAQYFKKSVQELFYEK